MSEKKIKQKILEGTVTSDQMDKTIVVTVTTRWPHTTYKKYVVKRKKYKVHDEQEKAKVGDKVKIVETRPYSKEKFFKLMEIVK